MLTFFFLVGVYFLACLRTWGEECGVLGLVESSRDKKAVLIELVEFLPCVCCNSEFAHCLCIKYTTMPHSLQN